MKAEIAIPDRTFWTRSETARTRQRSAWPGTAAACATPPATPWLRATLVYFTAMNFLAIFCSFFFNFEYIWVQFTVAVARPRQSPNCLFMCRCSDPPVFPSFECRLLLNNVLFYCNWDFKFTSDFDDRNVCRHIKIPGNYVSLKILYMGLCKLCSCADVHVRQNVRGMK